MADQKTNLDKYDSQPSLQESNLKRQVVTQTLWDGLRGQAKTLPYGKHESSTKMRAVLRGSPNVTS